MQEPKEEVDVYLTKVRKVARALERAGVFCKDGTTRVAFAVVGNQGDCSRWIADVRRGLFDKNFRYVLKIRCRECGHELRVNQGARRIRHEWKHR